VHKRGRSGKSGCDNSITSLHTVDIFRSYSADLTIRDGGTPPPLFTNKRFKGLNDPKVGCTGSEFDCCIRI
jgi:hypothetical protein